MGARFWRRPFRLCSLEIGRPQHGSSRFGTVLARFGASSHRFLYYLLTYLRFGPTSWSLSAGTQCGASLVASQCLGVVVLDGGTGFRRRSFLLTRPHGPYVGRAVCGVRDPLQDGNGNRALARFWHGFGPSADGYRHFGASLWTGRCVRGTESQRVTPQHGNYSHPAPVEYTCFLGVWSLHVDGGAESAVRCNGRLHV